MARETFTTDRIARPVGPFSPAVRAGDCVYVSGQIAQDPATGRLIAGDVTVQSEPIFRNLEAVLHAAGKVTVAALPLGAAVEIDLIAR